MATFESLPVELIADILGELDIATLVTVAYLSRRLHIIASDSSLNPWRRPILCTLRDRNGEYEPALKHLSVRHAVPRQNWVEILTLGKAEYLLFEMTLPNLKECEWEECFRRRFLPGWVKWKTTTWKAAFLKILHRLWHRSHSSCTADESWTKYILINRNGSANLLDGSSRNYNPMTTFHEMKLQNNLAHLPTHVRVRSIVLLHSELARNGSSHVFSSPYQLVVEFRDVRIIALGVLSKPRSSFSVNRNARLFLHPPGITRGEDETASASTGTMSEGSEDCFPNHVLDSSYHARRASSINLKDAYRPLSHPLPSPCHANYPFYTPSGEDKRWLGSEEMEEGGREWVGPMLLTAQLIGPQTKQQFEDGGPRFQDLDLVMGQGRSQYAALSWLDLEAIAPWLEFTAKINGQGLGH